MNPESLIGAPVALMAPDGREFRFHVAALVPYAGETYAVLEQDGEDGQMLVTAVEMTEDHIPSFVVQGEEDIITGVMEKLVARSIARVMEQCEEEDGPCEHDHHPCSCGHDHHHHQHECSCGHDHHHHH